MPNISNIFCKYNKELISMYFAFHISLNNTLGAKLHLPCKFGFYIRRLVVNELNKFALPPKVLGCSKLIRLLKTSNSE